MGTFPCTQDEHRRKKEEEQKSKSLTISHELYQTIQKDTLAIFKKKQEMHANQELED